MSSETVIYGGEQDTLWLSQSFWNLSGFSGLTPAELAGATAWIDNFIDLPTGKYTATQATAGTFALDDAEGGVALVDCNSTTSTQGINVQLGGTAGELFKPAAGRNIYFEARIHARDIATGPEFFLGLAITDTTLLAASALSSQAIGFKSLTDDSIILATCKDGSSETTASGIHTFIDYDTTPSTAWVKLGFVVVGTTAVKFYVDGVYKATITANIPTTEMRPTIVCQSAGTTDPIIAIDWGACYQERAA